MPFLLPPPEFKPGELAEMGLTGTCELQICRSAGPWSMGTPERIEHSIQNAYLKGEWISRTVVLMMHVLTTAQQSKCLIISCTSRTSSSLPREFGSFAWRKARY